MHDQVIEIEAALAKASKPNSFDWYYPWRVIPDGGKPIIAGAKSGNLFRGFIGTWAEADLVVALVNAAPALLAELKELREKVEAMRAALNEARKRLRHIAEDFADPDEIADDPEAFGGTDDGDETVRMAYENMQVVAACGLRAIDAALSTQGDRP